MAATRLNRMHPSIIRLYALIAVFALIRTSLEISMHARGQPPPCIGYNSEATFGCGAKVALSHIDAADLILIPGVSDGLATELLARSGEIIALAALLPTDRRFRAFTLVRGVGEKTAKRLDDWISPD